MPAPSEPHPLPPPPLAIVCWTPVPPLMQCPLSCACLLALLGRVPLLPPCGRSEVWQHGEATALRCEGANPDTLGPFVRRSMWKGSSAGSKHQSPHAFFGRRMRSLDAACVLKVAVLRSAAACPVRAVALVCGDGLVVRRPRPSGRRGYMQCRDVARPLGALLLSAATRFVSH